MSSELSIKLGFQILEPGWRHIIDVLKNDPNPSWRIFDQAVIEIIERGIKNAHDQQAQNNEQDVIDSEKHHLGDDGKFHDEEYFAERYGSYGNYLLLEDEADDMGFPDADMYRDWLDDN